MRWRYCRKGKRHSVTSISESSRTCPIIKVMSVSGPSGALLPATEDPVLFKMLAEERSGGEEAKTSLIIGLVCTILLSVGMAVLMTVLCIIWFGSSGITFYGWVLVMLGVSTGVCFLIDRKTRGKRWADAQIAGPVFHPVVDKLLFAHRFLVGGIQRKQNVPASIDTMVIERGARLVHHLGAVNLPQSPAQLLEPDDSPTFLGYVIAHLTERDWIGHSSDGQKLWLSSRAKNLLTKWGLIGPNA